MGYGELYPREAQIPLPPSRPKKISAGWMLQGKLNRFL